jgi:hypothetical protein
MAETFSQGNVPWWTNTERQLLAKILNAIGGGGGGGGGVSCGAVNPVAAPSSTCAIYFNTAAGSLWAWNGSAWLPLVV